MFVGLLLPSSREHGLVSPSTVDYSSSRNQREGAMIRQDMAAVRIVA